MRKKIYNILMCAPLLSLCGCSNEADMTVPDSEKQSIELSVGVESPTTRSVVTDGTGKTLEALPTETGIWMLMQSDYKALSDAGINYKGTQSSKYSVTYGTAGTPTDNENPISFASGNIRYWDDAHARSSALNVYALAVPGKTAALSTSTPWNETSAWSTTALAKTISWTIPAAQDKASIEDKDLCFSNNIANYSDDSRMKYGSDFKFEKGKLIFYHALTKITIKMEEGKGFDNTSTADFNFVGTTSETAAPVTLKGFKLGGTFDVAQGEFTSQDASTTTITSMYNKEKTATGYTLEAYVMPGTTLGSTGPADMLSFSIDGNAFKVSSETIAASLCTALGQEANTNVTLEAGKNYILKFTINKTDIKLTATIGKWEDVEGTNYSPLINVTEVYGQDINGEQRKDFAKNFSFYYSDAVSSGYKKGTDITYNSSAARKYTLDTPLYWPNHSTHYFFRGIWPVVGDGGTPTEKVSTSAVTVSNVAYSDGTYPSSLMIAYPRKDDGTSSDEACKVHSGTSGICATQGDIRMNFQYVMSQVVVNLSTNPEETATNKVVFDENTKVEIIGGYTDGSILLKDGSASLTTKADYEMNRFSTSNIKYHDAIIPQSLTDLRFRITVSDGSSYDSYETVLGIADIEISGSDKISKWEPGKRYIYNLMITKTGIKITATIEDWKEVTANSDIWM